MKQIGIFGTSGMAREAGDVAYDLGLTPIFVALDKSELDGRLLTGEAIVEADVLRYRDLPFVIGIGESKVRQGIAERYGGRVTFCNLIHSSATFGYRQRQSIEDRRGLIVCAGVRFTNGIHVGDFSIFNQNAIVAHDVTIGDFAHLAPGSTISGNVDIGSHCWIGAGAVINQGTRDSRLQIGSNTIIGSGAVVIRSCESNAIYAGVPAERIK